GMGDLFGAQQQPFALMLLALRLLRSYLRFCPYYLGDWITINLSRQKSPKIRFAGTNYVKLGSLMGHHKGWRTNSEGGLSRDPVLAVLSEPPRIMARTPVWNRKGGGDQQL